MPQTQSDDNLNRMALVRVWDVPTRLIHWLLVGLVALSWWSAETGYQDIHVVSGYAVLVLVLVRIFWGVAGATPSRFSDFLYSPSSIWKYAKQLFRRPGQITPGHNPMGGLSVLMLLSLLLVQPILGLFARDIDGQNSGPLSYAIGYSAGRTIAEVHHLLFEVLLIFVVIHLIAVAFYVFYKRDNIVLAMISGFKQLPEGQRKKIEFPPARRAVMAFIGFALVATFIHFAGAEF